MFYNQMSRNGLSKRRFATTKSILNIKANRDSIAYDKPVMHKT